MMLKWFLTIHRPFSPQSFLDVTASSRASSKSISSSLLPIDVPLSPNPDKLPFYIGA